MSKETQRKKKAKAAAALPPAPPTRVGIVDHCTETTLEEGEGEWDRGVTHYHHHIVGVRVLQPQEYWEETLEVGFPLDQPTYFLLYVLYRDGDSFGSTEGLVHYVGLYRTRAEAEVNERRIADHAARRFPAGTSKRKRDSYENEYSVELISPSGNPFRQGTPWKGYFGGLEDICIEEVRVDHDDRAN